MELKEKKRYWMTSLIVIILALGIILFKQLVPLMSGLLGALTIYILVRGQMIWLAEKKRVHRGIAATLITAEVIVCFLVPLGILVWIVIGMAKDFNLDPQTIIAPLQQGIDIIRQKTGYDLLGGDTLSFVISLIPRVGQYVMNSVSSFGFNMVILVIVLYFMLVGGSRMERYVSELLPFNTANAQDVTHEILRIV
ncbi:MAG: AI-2E family transporter, partial [Mediterranea sp.]|nr:AI-2E family transporter [Mediterranea sp.]